MTRYGRCALVALLALCNVSSTDANIYNRLRQSGGNAFNPLMRVGIRGGETSTKSNPAIPKVPTSKAELGASSASVAGPPRKKKRKKRSSSSSIAQQPAIPPAPVPAPAPVVKQTPVVVEKVVEEPKVEPQPEPEPIAVSTPPVEPEPEPVISVPAPPKPKPKSKITEKAQNNKKLAETLKEKMPTLFVRDEEKQYDTYAACLAATESLRRIRDSKRKNMKEFSAVDVEGKSWKSILNPSSDSSGGGDKNGEPTAEEEYKRACAEYVLNSSKAINALGLSVTQFNQLGREISKDKSLKEKVMEQAYLYRMASTIKMNKIPLIQDPDSKQLLKSTRRRRVQMFVRSITEIEELRAEQNQRLRKALSIDKIPADINLCDPNVMPLLSPTVRSVIEAFPLQAEEIVKKYGLNSDEFNQMLEETKGNPIFRWRVQRQRKNKQFDDEDFGYNDDDQAF